MVHSQNPVLRFRKKNKKTSKYECGITNVEF